MEPQIYFVRESPDFNLMLENGRIERMTANRVVICTMTEYGICNDRRMSAGEYSSFIKVQQMATYSKLLPTYSKLPTGTIKNIST